MDQEKGPQLDCKMTTVGVKAEGGTPGTPGVAVEPSGGVVGLSTKHQ